MTLFPTLKYRDAPAAQAFLVDAFGFELVADYRNEQDPSVVEHSELRWPGGGGVMLGTHRPDGEPKDLPAGVGSVYVVAEDIDALHARAVAAGAAITRALIDQDYGSREFGAKDPEGVNWSFGTYAGAAQS